jgi:hypothetical protein
MEGIYHTHLNGILIWAWAQHVEHNENNTKYCANILKRSSKLKTIHRLVVNGKDITNKSQIIGEAYFAENYKRKNVEKNNLFNITHYALKEKITMMWRITNWIWILTSSFKNAK